MTESSLCRAYLRSLDEDEVTAGKTYAAWHFCDNETDANELAALVKAGRKRATAGSLWACEHAGQSRPKVGDLSVILDWAGEAQCIIRTSRIDIVPFEEVTAEFAWTEGEGDRSLDHWRDRHWRFLLRELTPFGRQPDRRMLVVCEWFEVVFAEAE